MVVCVGTAANEQQAEGLNMEQTWRKRNDVVIVAMVTALFQCGTASAQDMKPFLTLNTRRRWPFAGGIPIKNSKGQILGSIGA